MSLQEIIDVIGDRFAFTPAERVILQYILLGVDNESVAKELFLSCKTVRNHITNILSKTGGMRRKELQAMALVISIGDHKENSLGMHDLCPSTVEEFLETVYS